MNIILLSGGSGKRLWPLSNDVRSKQFIEVFKKPDGSFESMVQRMYRMIQEVDPNTTVTIATSESQVESIRNQLGNTVGISVEPCRRDTFPAIALAVSYLKDVRGMSESDSVVVCPVDPFVEKDYFETVQSLQLLAEEGRANLSLMGIEPTEPSEKYGYIIPKTKKHVSVVESFKEKPDRRTAEQYLTQGALWNAGVFSFKISYVLEIAKREFGTSSYSDLKNNYSTLKKISFDYAVVEKEPNIQVMRFSGQWKDLGTWDALTEVLNYTVAGNVICNECDNTHIINELNTPLLALGLNNAVVVATPDGILVSDKDHSDKLKSSVPDGIPMYEQKSWGYYSVIETPSNHNDKKFIVRHIFVKPGNSIPDQINSHCDVIWAVVCGEGEIEIDDSRNEIKRGSSVIIRRNNHYSVRAKSELEIIETTIEE